VTAPSLSLDLRERRALADLLDELGPDAPTCDEGWTTAHLAAHLVTRDRRPDAMVGYGVERLPGGRAVAAWSHTVEDRLRTSTPYPALVARVRSGPPAWLPTAWPAVARLINTSEFVIHHEDARRAQPGWAPRDLPRADQDQLWRAVGVLARMAAHRHAGGLRLRRTDTGAERVLGSGTPGTTVAGEPLELLLWASGRERFARVDIS
jgi:uncharacterized protein (TIGR03085 family)